MASNRERYCDHTGTVNCTTCGAPISRRWTHAHTYSRVSGTRDHLCASCFGRIVTAANVVIQALHSMGLDPDGRELAAMIEGDYIAVLVQIPLMQATSLN